MLNEKKLDFYLQHNMNVLFEGVHGVGKTHIIIEAFKRNNLRYAYFSGATLDPYVDFVGVPVKVATEGGEVLRFIRPEHLVNLDVQVIFMDELNRAHKKVRNAVMELIQFKTINGVPFSKDLRAVWAAINPDSDEEDIYDTDRLDPAQRDRFQVQIQVPHICDREYFQGKYGSAIGAVAIDFWNKLSANVKTKVSPRRLDYAIEMYKLGGDIRDVLPKEANPSALLNHLRVGPVEEHLKNFFQNKSDSEAKEFLGNLNNLQLATDHITKNDQYISYFFPYIPKENQSQLFLNNQQVFKVIGNEYKLEGSHEPLIESLSTAKLSSKHKEALTKLVKGRAYVISKQKKEAYLKKRAESPEALAEPIGELTPDQEAQAKRDTLYKLWNDARYDYTSTFKYYQRAIALYTLDRKSGKFVNYKENDIENWLLLLDRMVARKHAATLDKMPAITSILAEILAIHSYEAGSKIQSRTCEHILKYAKKNGIC
jgi:hypothetical protein